MKYALIAMLLLSGCTVTVEDRRLSREEVAAAFAQRDAALVGLTKAVAKLIKAQSAPEAKK